MYFFHFCLKRRVPFEFIASRCKYLFQNIKNSKMLFWTGDAESRSSWKWQRWVWLCWLYHFAASFSGKDYRKVARLCQFVAFFEATEVKIFLQPNTIGILLCWKFGNSSMTFLTPGQASIDFTYGFNLACIYQEAYRRHWHFQPSKWTVLIASFTDNPWIKLEKVLDFCHRNDNIDSKSKYLLSLINSSLCHF